MPLNITEYFGTTSPIIQSDGSADLDALVGYNASEPDPLDAASNETTADSEVLVPSHISDDSIKA